MSKKKQPTDDRHRINITLPVDVWVSGRVCAAKRALSFSHLLEALLKKEAKRLGV